MTSEAGLLFFKTRSNCFPALLGRQPSHLLPRVWPSTFLWPPCACLFPCDPSPGPYPASDGVGWKTPFPSPFTTYVRLFDLPGQAGGRFPAGADLWRALPVKSPQVPHQAEAAAVGSSWEAASEEGLTGLPYELLGKVEAGGLESAKLAWARE